MIAMGKRGLPFLLLVGVGCAAPQSGVPPAAPAGAMVPEAWIGATAARFIFPTEPHGELEWDVPDSGAYKDRPEYYWEVSWVPGESTRGKVPDGLSLVTYWRAGGPRRGSVADLVSQWHPSVMTECLQCDGVSIPREDSALTVDVVNGHVEFSILGAPGVQRVFPVVPDSVRFIRHLGLDAEDEEFIVPVRRGRR
jgi:hypothetical protein